MDVNSDTEHEEFLLEQLVEEEYEAEVHAIFTQWFEPSPYPANRPSRLGRSPKIDKERRVWEEQIVKDYFAEEPVYTDTQFRRRFRMCRPLFLSILAQVVAHDDYFNQKRYALGLMGLSSIQKITCALRMLAYGSAADSLDEYLRIGESTALKCLLHFCSAIVEVYSRVYLRNPTMEDVQRIISFNQDRGFPGMMGSIDCMHWGWKICPKAWAGQYAGRSKHPTIVLEAVASYDTWFWHAFFGMPGSMNDINVLGRSHLFKDQIQGVAPKASFRVNGKLYRQTYLLSDGIYPQWGTFVKTIANPQGEKRKYFAKMQESARKDVERAFGILQARWAIVREPARSWSIDTVRLIMTTCIILHNMIVEDEHDEDNFDCSWLDEQQSQVVRGGLDRDSRLPTIIMNTNMLRDEHRHHELRGDLIEHLWQKKGEN